MQLSLWLAELPEGMSFLENFISPSQEEDLLRKISQLSWEAVFMFGIEARRLVVHYGYSYDFDHRLLQKTREIPAWLEPLRGQCAAQLQTTSNELAEALITRYPPGAGIGWHRDAPQFELLIGISLGNDCRFKMRRISHPKDVLNLELPPRSAYILSGPSRWLWQHHIPPVKVERYSITFRTLRS